MSNGSCDDESFTVNRSITKALANSVRFSSPRYEIIDAVVPAVATQAPEFADFTRDSGVRVDGRNSAFVIVQLMNEAIERRQRNNEPIEASQSIPRLKSLAQAISEINSNGLTFTGRPIEALRKVYDYFGEHGGSCVDGDRKLRVEQIATMAIDPIVRRC